MLSRKQFLLSRKQLQKKLLTMASIPPDELHRRRHESMIEEQQANYLTSRHYKRNDNQLEELIHAIGTVFTDMVGTRPPNPNETQIGHSRLIRLPGKE